MLTSEQIKQAAKDLHTAEKERRQIAAISLQHTDMNMDDAYAIQKNWVDMKLAEGREVIGYKVGLTSRAMQMTMHIDEPDYGTLLDDMLIEDGADIEAARFCDPRIEVELAFILKDKLEGADITIFDVLNATDYVIPALELIAARSYRIDPERGQCRHHHGRASHKANGVGPALGGCDALSQWRDGRNRFGGRCA